MRTLFNRAIVGSALALSCAWTSAAAESTGADVSSPKFTEAQAGETFLQVLERSILSTPDAGALTPETLFWGQYSTPLKAIDNKRLKLDEITFVYNALLMMNDRHALARQNFAELNDGKRIIINRPVLNGLNAETRAKGLTAEDEKRLGIYDRIMGEINSFNARYKDATYQERFDAALPMLADFGRDIDYEIHNLQANRLGAPKTPVQAEADGKADCTYFALARYLLGQRFGIKPEHMMVVVLLPRESNAGDGGHVVLSIYNPGRNVWTFIDGTGRSGDDPSTIWVVDNDNRNREMMGRIGADKTRFADWVPAYAVTRAGIVLFGNNKAETAHDSLVTENPACYARTGGINTPCYKIARGGLLAGNAPH